MNILRLVRLRAAPVAVTSRTTDLPGTVKATSVSTSAERRVVPSLGEPLVVLVVALIVTLLVFITYARLPASEFYNVSGTGLTGGASRALVVLNYPVAFLAIALVGFAIARLYAFPGALSRGSRWLVGGVAIVAVGLCLVAAYPGVVSPDNLDAKSVNALPALGVLLAIGIMVLTLRATGVGFIRPTSTGDRYRVVLAMVLVFLGLPWILADVGVYIGDLPLLNTLFMSKQIPDGETLRAVHLGHHHGTDGLMFVLAGLALSRGLVDVGYPVLRWLLAGYVALMFTYGSINAAQDFWLEQVVKRGWTTFELPNMLVPAVTPQWGVLVLVTIILAGILIRNAGIGSMRVSQ